MELSDHWNEITSVVNSGQKSSLHCSIATVDDQGMPNVTPIGTVFLRSNLTGYFFDSYTSKLAANLEHNNKACLSAVNTKTSFWFKSLLKGKFLSPPGVRLYGTVSQLREATEEEIAAVNKRIKPLSWSKGSKLIWSSFTHVRDIEFNDFRPVQYPKMMEHLW
ncbi:MAG: pyridoxine/pyridoxamine 5'-phosphate oxidase [Oceanicoccus sp.]|jgi:pyridoxine/pyridoxamine 5'-phosphate oxidase